MQPEFHASRLQARTMSPQVTWRVAYLIGWLVLGAMLAADSRSSHAADVGVGSHPAQLSLRSSSGHDFSSDSGEMPPAQRALQVRTD